MVELDTPTGAAATKILGLGHYRPGTVITNDRLGGGYTGDYHTTEQTIPGSGQTEPWRPA